MSDHNLAYLQSCESCLLSILGVFRFVRCWDAHSVSCVGWVVSTRVRIFHFPSAGEDLAISSLATTKIEIAFMVRFFSLGLTEILAQQKCDMLLKMLMSLALIDGS